VSVKVVALDLSMNFLTVFFPMIVCYKID
jgi:hypothetical protein